MTQAPLLPRTYDEWRHCITMLCRIPLTPSFVDQRLAALNDPRDHMTERFVATWGADHLEQVKGWFEEARARFAKGDAA